MKIRFLGKFCLIHLVAWMMAVPMTAQPKAAARAVLDISAAPNQRTWTSFHKSSEELRSQLWRSYERQGKALKNWSWQWRLGWIRVCSQSSELYCGRIFEEALQDRALVVRAEAATLLGRRFAGSHHKRAFELLEMAYRNPSNRKDGEPLFVQYRILAALYSIAPQWQDKIDEIAEDSAATREYLAKLSR